MANLNFNQVPPARYVQLVREQAIRPRFRLSLLYPDESFREDISEYLIQGTLKDKEEALILHSTMKAEFLLRQALTVKFGLIPSLNLSLAWRRQAGTLYGIVQVSLSLAPLKP